MSKYHLREARNNSYKVRQHSRDADKAQFFEFKDDDRHSILPVLILTSYIALEVVPRNFSYGVHASHLFHVF